MGIDDLIRVPEQWPHPNVSAVEDRIDSALSSANGILNFALGPVRGFVGAVLHPIISFADRTLDWIFGVIHWGYDHARDIAGDARRAIAAVIDYIARETSNIAGQAFTAAVGMVSTLRREAFDAIDGLRRLVGSSVGAFSDVIQGIYDKAMAAAQWFARLAANEAKDFARSLFNTVGQLVDQATAIARRLFDQAVDVARQLAGDVRSFAATAVEGAISFARGVLTQAIDAAKSLVDVLMRTVVAPLVGRFEDFVGQQWRWAIGLLHLIEDVGEWLLWVDRWLVHEAVATYRAIRDLADADLTELAGIGVSLGARR